MSKALRSDNLFLVDGGVFQICIMSRSWFLLFSIFPVLFWNDALMCHVSSVFHFLSLTRPFLCFTPPVPHPLVSVCIKSLYSLLSFFYSPVLFTEPVPVSPSDSQWFVFQSIAPGFMFLPYSSCLFWIAVVPLIVAWVFFPSLVFGIIWLLDFGYC